MEARGAPGVHGVRDDRRSGPPTPEPGDLAHPMVVTRAAHRWRSASGRPRASGHPRPPRRPGDAGDDSGSAPGGLEPFEDTVVTEYPLTILLNGRELATVVCSPSHLEELVLGFLTAEGILRRDEPVRELYVIPDEGIAVVEAPDRAEAPESEMLGKRWVGSCCGKSRAGFYFANDARTARPVTGDLRLAAADCARLMRELHAASPLFAATGGVHNAGLATRRGVEVVRTDIGRHNTLDKLYGHALRTRGLALEERAVVFSGRISSEVLLKVVKLGCPILLSKSAPTDLALDLAEELGVTTVGFLRDDAMNVYTRTERIVPSSGTPERD